MTADADTAPATVPLAETARATVARYEMLPEGSPVLALVSGGADSVALLRLVAAGELGPIASLAVLHVDHALRPESAEDASWTQALCAELGVACQVVRQDVGAFAAREGLNLEDAGRRVRYALADEHADALAEEAGVAPSRARIAVAHNLDDRVETLLMRLAEGAGPAGLASLRPVRARIVRPLIDVRRAAIRDWLAEQGATWREDASNADTDRKRAWVRHELLPLFESANPAFAEAAARTATLMADDDDLLDELASAFARDFDVTRPDDGDGIALDRRLMSTLSRPMARRVLRSAITGRFPEASRIEYEHIEAVVDGIGSDSFARDLTGGLRAASEYDRIIISLGGSHGKPLEEAELAVPGVTELGGAGLIEAEIGANAQVNYDVRVAAIDASTVGLPLTVGPPREGERMRPLGMSGSKKLSDLLGEAKVPVRLRPQTPVVRDGDAVVWVAGVRTSEDHKVTPATERVITLTWRPGGDRRADAHERDPDLAR